MTPNQAPKAIATAATVFVYGHGPAKNPFFKAAQAVKMNSHGCSLLLAAPVARGQKLLLMKATQEDPMPAEVVTTRSVGSQMYEVEVAFAA